MTVYRPITYNDRDGRDFLYKLIGKHADNAKLYKVPEQIASNLKEIAEDNEFIEIKSFTAYVVTIKYNCCEVKHAIIKDVALGWLTTMEIPRLVTLLASGSNDVTPVYIEVPKGDKPVKESSLCLIVALLDQCPYPVKVNMNGETVYINYGSERLRIGARTFDTRQAFYSPVSLSALVKELSQLVPISYHVSKFDNNLVKLVDYVTEERVLSEYGVALYNINGKSIVCKNRNFILSELEQKDLQRELFGDDIVDYLNTHYKGINLNEFKLAGVYDNLVTKEQINKIPFTETLGEDIGYACHMKYHGVSTDLLFLKLKHGDAYLTNMSDNLLRMLLCNYTTVSSPSVAIPPLIGIKVPINKCYAYAIAGLCFTIPYRIMYKADALESKVSCDGEILTLECGRNVVHCNINKEDDGYVSTEDLFNIARKYVPAEVQIAPYDVRRVPSIAPYQVLDSLGLEFYRVDNVVFVVKKDMFVMRLSVFGYYSDINKSVPDAGDTNISDMIDMFVALHKDGEVGVHIATLLDRLHVSEDDVKFTLDKLIKEIGG